MNPQMQSAFPQTNYGPANYAVAGQPAGDPQQQNGTAPLPPLNPPENDHFDEAMEVAQPFTLSKSSKCVRRWRTRERRRPGSPYGNPRISSVSVDLSPGASMPVLRVVPGELSNLIVLDSTGLRGRWPLRLVFLTPISIARNGCRVPIQWWCRLHRLTRPAA